MAWHVQSGPFRVLCGKKYASWKKYTSGAGGAGDKLQLCQAFYTLYFKHYASRFILHTLYQAFYTLYVMPGARQHAEEIRGEAARLVNER